MLIFPKLVMFIKKMKISKCVHVFQKLFATCKNVHVFLYKFKCLQQCSCSQKIVCKFQKMFKFLKKCTHLKKKSRFQKMFGSLLKYSSIKKMIKLLSLSGPSTCYQVQTFVVIPRLQKLLACLVPRLKQKSAH